MFKYPISFQMDQCLQLIQMYLDFEFFNFLGNNCILIS